MNKFVILIGILYSSPSVAGNSNFVTLELLEDRIQQIEQNIATDGPHYYLQRSDFFRNLGWDIDLSDIRELASTELKPQIEKLEQKLGTHILNPSFSLTFLDIVRNKRLASLSFRLIGVLDDQYYQQ